MREIIAWMKAGLAVALIIAAVVSTFVMMFALLLGLVYGLVWLARATDAKSWLVPFIEHLPLPDPAYIFYAIVLTIFVVGSFFFRQEFMRGSRVDWPKVKRAWNERNER